MATSPTRIFHPLEGLRFRRWSDLARANGRVAHAAMQYRWISRPPGAQADRHEYLHHLSDGALPADELDLLVEVFAGHTPADEGCFFAIWEGYGHLHGAAAPGPPAAPRLELPSRPYLVLSGSLAEVRVFRHSVGWPSPNLWWPRDRSWCVASEIDFATTYVAGSDALISAVVAEEGLEAWRCEVSDGVTDDAEVVNAALDGDTVHRWTRPPT